MPTLCARLCDMKWMHADRTQGMYYKFAAEVKTQSFADAPDVILKALHLLTWAAQTAVNMVGPALFLHQQVLADL